MKADEFIMVVEAEVASDWQNSDLFLETELAMEQIAWHLRGCRKCREEFDLFAEGAATLQDLGDVVPEERTCDPFFLDDHARGCVFNGEERLCRECALVCWRR